MRMFLKSLIILMLMTELLTGVSSSLACEKGVMQGMTAAHNRVRAARGLRELVWSKDLARFAKEWADQLAGRGCWSRHREDGSVGSMTYGENIFWASAVVRSGGARDVQAITAEGVVRAWASESQNYDPQDNRCAFLKKCGHYTQIVWRDTARLGCGMAFCADKSQVWVCNYDPPGNIRGRKAY